MGPQRKWSSKVTRESNAMDLEKGVFKKSPRAMAASLRRSATRSRRRKSDPFRSAMSMVNFYANRAGKNLSAADRKRIQGAKRELRRQCGRGARPRTSRRGRSGRARR